MDERELAGLLYRADWTRLTLAGTVRGAENEPDLAFSTVFTFTGGWPRRGWPAPPFMPPFRPDPDAERTLLVAPGKRYRLESADGQYAAGCDGEHAWQWFAEPLPPGMSIRSDDRPRPPLPVLLTPRWLLARHRLAIREEVTACGRPGVRVLATRRDNRARGPLAAPWPIPPVPPIADIWDEADVVVDAELGILLRFARHSGDQAVMVTEFLSLTVGDAVGPARFSAPEGSVPGTGGGDSTLGQDVVKTVAGLAAGGLGAAIRFGGSRHADAFGRATAEADDPEAAMPPGDPFPGDRAAGQPVRDEALHLLHRAGLTEPRFTATLHQWHDFGAMLGAVPERARRTGLGGVGFLVDAIRDKTRGSGAGTGHEVSSVRMGGWSRYRIDVTLPATFQAGNRDRMGLYYERRGPRTIACDGQRSWTVYDDRVVTGPAGPPPGEVADLVDGSWLLTCELTGGEEVLADDGRRAYRVIAHKPEPLATEPMPFATPWWLPDLMGMETLPGPFFPVVAVLDAETGTLLQVTWYAGGQPALRSELRDVTPVPGDEPDDFGFSPPAGLRVDEEAGPGVSWSSFPRGTRRG